MNIPISDITKQLPKQDTTDYRRLNNELFEKQHKTCVVIDDDPTGNQTVYNVPLLTQWDVETITEEFKKETPVFFLLTNSRSLPQNKSSDIFKTITDNVLSASKKTGRDFTMVSRSDSTLRGHFSEIEAISQKLNWKDSITFFIPVMFEGGRVTINNTHYILNNNDLTPVHETPFAQDHTFAYCNSNLTKYIEEKTSGRMQSSEVFVLSIEELRQQSVEELSRKIHAIPSGKFCIANAINYNDLDKVTNALLLAELAGKRINYRTSSSFVPSYIGLKPQNLIDPKRLIDFGSTKGGLIVVGSYVPKSSAQLIRALELFSQKTIVEVDVAKILGSNSSNYIATLSNEINNEVAKGNDVIVFTSRELITGKDSNNTIDIASKVSNALVDLIKNLTSAPKYLLAKGGITSNDLAIKGLNMKRSIVIGQIAPGIPVWKMGSDTKFPNLPYIVFPGNVGDEDSLLTIIKKLN